MAQIRAKAAAKGAKVTLDIAGDVRFGARFKVSVQPGTTNRIVIGPGSEFQDDVLIFLLGGSLLLGPGTTIRRGVVLHVGGEIELVGRNLISYYSVLHCDERIRLDEMSALAEHCTIADSRHFHDDSGKAFRYNLETSPVLIGRNVWVSNKAAILMGTTIGDEAIVAAAAVVVRDVPAGAVVGGIPAKVISSSSGS